MAKNERGQPYMSGEDRDRHPLCGAKTRKGGICRAFAGQGTDHLGIGRCKFHLGSTRNHRIAAERVMVEREVRALGEPIDVTPGQAITGLLRQAAGLVAVLSEKLEGAGGVDAPGAMTTALAFNSERDRLARFAKVAAEMGVDQRAIELAEEYTQLMADFIHAVTDRIELTAEQRRALGSAIREELAVITGKAVER